MRIKFILGLRVWPSKTRLKIVIIRNIYQARETNLYRINKKNQSQVLSNRLISDNKRSNSYKLIETKIRPIKIIK